jgi:uncharacterized protein (TIGR02217 family)
MASPFAPVRWLIDNPNITDPEIFPLLPGQTFVTDKRPLWATDVARSRSGREVRVSWMSAPLWNFEVSYEVLREAPGFDELSRLFAFFNVRAGKFGTFWYYDPSDHDAVNENIGQGNGIATIFQLTRSSYGFTEPIYKTFGTPTIYKNGIEVSAADYTLTDHGVLVFDTAPANGVQVSWTGEFMYWCRFDQDDLSATEMVQRLWSQDGLKFVSLKP